MATKTVKITYGVNIMFLSYSAAPEVPMDGVIVLYIEVNLAVNSHKIEHFVYHYIFFPFTFIKRQSSNTYFQKYVGSVTKVS